MVYNSLLSRVHEIPPTLFTNEEADRYLLHICRVLTFEAQKPFLAGYSIQPYSPLKVSIAEHIGPIMCSRLLSGAKSA